MTFRNLAPFLMILACFSPGCGGPTHPVPHDAGLRDAAGFDAAPDALLSPDAPMAPPPDAACGPVGREACEATEPRACSPEVFVGPVGLSERLVGLIGEARAELRIAIYEIDSAPILSALERAVAEGVQVRLLVDGDREANIAPIRRLREAGVEIREGASDFPYYHPKYLIVDQGSATVMSANLNEYSMQTERNHGVTLRDPQDIEDLVSLFEADWSGADLGDPLRCTRLVLSPINSRARLHALIRSADTELRLQHLSLSDRSTRTLLGQRAAAGVRVQVLLAHPEWIESNQTAAEVLRGAGVEVRFQRALENHTKLIIADMRAASVGSINLSYSSLDRNREVGVIITDGEPVTELLRAFDADWRGGAAR